MRNSSLVEWFCAENVPGLKHITEAADSSGSLEGSGRGAFLRRMKLDRKDGWTNGSDYAGMSSDKGGENPPPKA